MRFDGTAALRIWYAALAEEIGVTLTIDPADFAVFQQKMYEVRKDSGDARLKDLTMHINADHSRVLIYHNARLP